MHLAGSDFWLSPNTSRNLRPSPKEVFLQQGRDAIAEDVGQFFKARTVSHSHILERGRIVAGAASAA
jgi:hypothetical protein